MTVTINGTTGIAGVDGSAATPAVQGADTNTGIFFPAADAVGIATSGTEQVRVASAGQIGIGGANYGTSGQVLTSGGSAAAPSWATVTSAKAANYQLFDASSTWTKPSGYGSGSRVHVQAWGAGQGGGRGGNHGGGGGSYVEYWLLLSSFGATETITIGAGGAARATNGGGNAGGNTTVGSLVTAYGGSNGSGGSPLMAGVLNATSSGVATMRPGAILGIGGTAASAFRSTITSGSGRTDSAGTAPTAIQISAGDGFFGGGGGTSSGSDTVGGWSVYGGAGGGTGSSGTGGTSIYGGNGGAGTLSGTGGTGVQPGGGGGGTTTTGTSGAGAAGRVILTVFDGVIG
jgi:hypothetical protein